MLKGSSSQSISQSGAGYKIILLALDSFQRDNEEQTGSHKSLVLFCFLVAMLPLSYQCSNIQYMNYVSDMIAKTTTKHGLKTGL